MANFNIDYLVVAGGGGGSSGYGGSPQGGGGAGGLRTSYGSTSGGGASAETSLLLTGGTVYALEVGVGGVGAANSSGAIGAQGTSSSFDTISTVGGGGSRNWNSGSPSGTGGSGGGEAYATNGGPGAGTANQGYAGGSVTVNGPGAGGGGAGSAGSWAASPTLGIGGNGLDIDITGSTVSYAGGGGRTVGTPRGGGGFSASSSGVGGNGLANTGGGGGGGYGTGTGPGGTGGSGVVILRYVTADVISYTTTGITPTEDTTTVSGQTILSFTTVGTGTITFTAPPPPIPFDGTRATTPVTGFNKTGTSEGLKLPSGDNNTSPVGALAEQGMIRNDTEETVDSSASAMTHYNGTNWQYFAATESPDIVYPTSLKMYLDASDTTSYPGTGTTWFDLTSNGNNGIISGATFSPSNASFDFNGSSGYIDVNNFVNSFFNNAVNKIFSVSIWFNPDQLPTSSTPFQLWQFGAWSDGTVRAFLLDNGKINFQSTIGGSSYVNQLNSSTSYSIGNWNNLVCVYDGTTKHLYLNNNPPNSAVHNYDIETNAGSIGKDDSSTYYFNGKISKFNVYDKALTQAEITAIYNEGR